MSINKNPYDIEGHIAEVYDNLVTEKLDADFIIKLLNEYKCKNVLEPFCGTGRILLPIAENGINVTGIDAAGAMLNRMNEKMKSMPDKVIKNVKIKKDDIVECDWGSNFDAVILGGNCFFELATLAEQEKVFEKACNAVHNSGYIFIDNDSIENELPDSWCNINVENLAFLSGICEDGIEIRSYSKTIAVEKKNKIWKAIRRVEVYKNDVMINDYAWEQQKHPVGYSEIVTMVEKHKMCVLNVWNGTESGKKHQQGDSRATFWLQK